MRTLNTTTLENMESFIIDYQKRKGKSPSFREVMKALKIKFLVLWDILCKNTDENHALNPDEISELLALRGLNVSRKIIVQDIAILCNNGYRNYKKEI